MSDAADGDKGTADGGLAAAVALHRAGRLDEAEALYRRALEAQPRNAHALHLLGVILYQKGRAAEAVRLLLEAVALAPMRADFFNHLGMARKASGRLDEAIAAYRQSTALNPAYAEAHYNLGNALQEGQRFEDAVASYRRVLEIVPEHAETLNNLGNALTELGRDGAAQCFERAVAANPRYPEALANLAATRVEAGDIADAIRRYEEAVEIDPLYAAAAAPLLHQYQFACAWDDYDALAPHVDSLTRRAVARGEMPAESPFQNVARAIDPALNLAVARLRSADIARRARLSGATFPMAGRRRPRQRLTVGYLSNDMRNHPIAHLCVGMYGLHDRSKVRVHCYSTGLDDGSHWRRKVVADCDSFVDIRGRSAVEAARRIHDDEVDILVDLMGYTKGHNLGLCALRPAPVQVAWLGFPGTMGADFFDYATVDRIVVPPDQAAFHSETLAYVCHCYQINDNAEPVSDTRPTRAEQGLPETGTVFCSFNQSYKYDRVMFGAWMKILAEVPGSVLWLMKVNDLAQPNLTREAASHRIDPARLIFSASIPKPDHMARLALADLALDTRIYGGHTSSSDALRAGVPVVTLQGGHFASRVASSILAAVNLPELVTHRLDDYTALAIRLGRDGREIARLKAALAAGRATAPLFDTTGFVRGLEELYRQMWERYEKGQTPRTLAIGKSR